MPWLLRRRAVWLPTLWGWLLLIGIGAALLAGFGFGVVGFLMPHEPARGPDGRGAHILVVEGWLDEADLDQAVAALRSRHYGRVLVTGGPIESWDDARVWKTYAARAAGYLRMRVPIGVDVIAVPAPATAKNRTYLSAVMVREWVRSAGIALDAIDLYSAGVHARRSRLVYRLAFGPTVEVGVLAAIPPGFDPQRWWSSSAGAKSVIGETLGLLWTECCFWPPAPRSADERPAATTPRG
ncbi:MAG: hypothetical protein ACREXI_01930 [Caldimonas sp.]